MEKEKAKESLSIIGEIYKYEDEIREKNLSGLDKLQYRQKYIVNKVDEFFSFLKKETSTGVYTSSSLFFKACSYAIYREENLRYFLSNPDVQIDTNHLERALRVIPMGRKNWLFCWSEVGAEYAGKIQSLITTCKLHKIDPYVYLVDVLLRIDTHKAKDVHLLTPRLWKENFMSNPLKSNLDLY